MNIGNYVDEINTVCDLPSSGDELDFGAPWQARGFALAVVLAEEGHIQWNDFQYQFSNIIDEQEGVISESEYFAKWIRALELTVTDNMASSQEIKNRVEAFKNGNRDASEFVMGVEHSHSHE